MARQPLRQVEQHPVVVVCHQATTLRPAGRIHAELAFNPGNLRPAKLAVRQQVQVRKQFQGGLVPGRCLQLRACPAGGVRNVDIEMQAQHVVRAEIDQQYPLALFMQGDAEAGQQRGGADSAAHAAQHELLHAGRLLATATLAFSSETLSSALFRCATTESSLSSGQR